DIRGQSDMDPEGEREICRWAEEKHGSQMVFITHFPTKKRPWYTAPDPNSPDETLSFDLIACGVEWITGGQRINDYKTLVSNIKKWEPIPRIFIFLIFRLLNLVCLRKAVFVSVWKELPKTF
ncbi:hypothetical protein KJ909_02360, partial [Patescibacteria group bacterium]|nr:hypothetical protein [Patescibacteria group bacterium]